jgi:hypothetical protein
MREPLVKPSANRQKAGHVEAQTWGGAERGLVRHAELEVALAQVAAHGGRRKPQLARDLLVRVARGIGPRDGFLASRQAVADAGAQREPAGAAVFVARLGRRGEQLDGLALPLALARLQQRLQRLGQGPAGPARELAQQGLAEVRRGMDRKPLSSARASWSPAATNWRRSAMRQ